MKCRFAAFFRCLRTAAALHRPRKTSLTLTKVKCAHRSGDEALLYSQAHFVWLTVSLVIFLICMAVTGQKGMGEVGEDSCSSQAIKDHKRHCQIHYYSLPVVTITLYC